MRSVVRATVTAAALAVAPLLAVVLFRPEHGGSAVAGFGLVVAAVLLHGLVRLTGSPQAHPFPPRRSRPLPPPERPPGLARLEREVALGIHAAFDFHSRLRPQLREIAAHRLESRRGIELDTEAARAALGEEAWTLLRPNREPPRDRFAAGVSATELERLVETLERI